MSVTSEDAQKSMVQFQQVINVVWLCHEVNCRSYPHHKVFALLDIGWLALP